MSVTNSYITRYVKLSFTYIKEKREIQKPRRIRNCLSITQLFQNLISQLQHLYVVFVLFTIKYRLQMNIISFFFKSVCTPSFLFLFQRLSLAVQDSLASANTAVNEVVSGIRVIRSFKTEKLEANRYNERLMDIRALKMHRDMIRYVYLLARRVRSLSFFLSFLVIIRFNLLLHTTFLSNICLSVCLCFQLTGLVMQVVMLYYGRLFIRSGQMSTGSLVSFIMYQSDLGNNIRVSHYVL